MAWHGMPGARRIRGSRMNLTICTLCLLFSSALGAPARTLQDVGAIAGAAPVVGATPANPAAGAAPANPFAGAAPAAPVAGAAPAAPIVGAAPAAPVVGAAPAAPVVGAAPAAPVVGAAPAAPVVGAAPAAPVVGAAPATPVAAPAAPVVVAAPATPVAAPAAPTTPIVAATPAAAVAAAPTAVGTAPVAAAAPTAGTIAAPPIAATPVAPAMAPLSAPAANVSSEPVVAPTVERPVAASNVVELNKTQLTAPDGFEYDFKLSDEDYILPLAALPHDNLTNLPAVPAAEASAYASAPASENPLMTWRQTILEHNKALWDAKANRKIKDGVNTLIQQADIYMLEPVFLVTNKTDARSPWEDNQDPRVYFSLSDYYWPFQVSSVNPTGIPYQYNASRNLQVYDLTPNKRHLELTIEHISTLALAYFFTGNQAYADRARQKAFLWFLDPQTAMVAKYAGRLAGVRRGGTKYGRPEGIFDMRGLPELLNGVALLAQTPSWSAADTSAMAAWVRDYVGFLEADPVAKYARMMGNFVATNVDEQLLAAYIYLYTEGQSAAYREKALQIAHYSGLRQKDQIVGGVFRYESPRQRSLDFTQQCLLSWVNIAIMSERLGVDVWSRGLGEGWSIKDAFDHNRPYFESLGVAWTFNQVGTPRVQVAGQLVPPMYVGYRLAGRINSGPVEYIQLYNTIWPTFTTAGSQARGIIERLPHLELDSIMADDGIPLIEECDNLLCDVRTLSIWGTTAFCLLLVSFCLCWNCYIHWKADRETDVPAFLQNIREQQAKYKRMNLKVAPAKPDYMIERKAREERRKMEEKLAREEEKKDKDLKQKIKATEEKLQRRRDSKMQSQMSSQMAPTGPYGSNMMGMPGSMIQPGMGYAPSVASHSQNGSSFYPGYDGQSDVASSVNGHNGGMHMAGGYAPGYGQPQFPQGYIQPQFSPAYGVSPFGHPSPEGWPGQGHNVQGQVILEEGGADYGMQGDYGGNEFSFPGVQEQEMQEGYGELDHMHEGPIGASSVVSHNHNSSYVPSGVPTSPRSTAGLTNPLSTGTGPSQSLTGLLAGANDLLGEMGTTQTTALTGTIPGAASSRTASFRQQQRPDSH